MIAVVIVEWALLRSHWPLRGEAFGDSELWILPHRVFGHMRLRSLVSLYCSARDRGIAAVPLEGPPPMRAKLVTTMWDTPLSTKSASCSATLSADPQGTSCWTTSGVMRRRNSAHRLPSNTAGSRSPVPPWPSPRGWCRPAADHARAGMASGTICTNGDEHARWNSSVVLARTVMTNRLRSMAIGSRPAASAPSATRLAAACHSLSWGV